jgi:S1-C subfamily serine protease
MSPSTSPIRLGPAQYAILVITLLVLIPLVTWFTIGNIVHDYYVDEIVAPQLQREFGFQVGSVRVGPGESGPDAWVAIAHIAAGSPLERAGIRRGDTGCLGVDTGGMHELYSALALLRQQSAVTVSVSNAAEGRQPCRTVTIRR